MCLSKHLIILKGIIYCILLFISAQKDFTEISTEQRSKNNFVKSKYLCR